MIWIFFGIHAPGEAQFPEMTDATILPGPAVPYDRWFRVDGHRARLSNSSGDVLQGELFPDIANCGWPDMISYRIKRHRQRRPSPTICLILSST